jgi:hypothetical protein
MNHVGRNTAESRQALESLKRRLSQNRASVLAAFKQSAYSNQSTKTDLTSLHLECLNKLEESFKNSIKSLEGVALENSVIKERTLLKLEEVEKKVKHLEDFFCENDDLPLADYHEISDFLKNLSENVRFRSLFVKKSFRVGDLARIFHLSDQEKEKKEVFEWLFVKSGTCEESLFDKYVEIQLERGFNSNSCQYKLYMKGERDSFGFVCFESMKMTVYNPRSEYKVIRRAVS